MYSCVTAGPGQIRLWESGPCKDVWEPWSPGHGPPQQIVGGQPIAKGDLGDGLFGHLAASLLDILPPEP